MTSIKIKVKVTIVLFLLAVITFLAVGPNSTAVEIDVPDKMPGGLVYYNNNPWPECWCIAWPMTCICKIIYIPKAE